MANIAESADVSLNRKRRPILAGFLSLLLPGLGHIYTGNLKKGLLLLVVPYVLVSMVGYLLPLSHYYAFMGLMAFVVCFYLYVFISSFLLARSNKTYQLKSYNRWYFYIGLIAVTWMASSLFSANLQRFIGFKTYRIPSASMDPTLQIGDYITVDTRYKEPVVGDVVVFIYPKSEDIDYVFRVVAVAGDTVSVLEDVVYRNGDVQASDYVNSDKSRSGKTIGNVSIPEGEFFVLGDNRGKSNDSRYWGNVPVSHIEGKVKYVWWSKTKSRIGTLIK